MRTLLIIGVVIGTLAAIGQLNQAMKEPEHRIGAMVYIAGKGPYPWIVDGKRQKQPMHEALGTYGRVVHSQGNTCRVEMPEFLELPTPYIVEIEAPCSTLSFKKPDVKQAEAKPKLDGAPKYVLGKTESKPILEQEDGGLVVEKAGYGNRWPYPKFDNGIIRCRAGSAVTFQANKTGAEYGLNGKGLGLYPDPRMFYYKDEYGIPKNVDTVEKWIAIGLNLCS